MLRIEALRGTVAGGSGSTNGPPSEAKAYLEDIGKLGWLADKSHPDIALVVNKLQRRAAAPRSEDGDALKQLNRYVKGMMDLGILLGKSPEMGLTGYVDASHYDNEDGKIT
ncbi:hypothetical protein N7501_005438 [Penicillium viridicatum]|nr:hypothetical protein N7501_005438 [Penicillium viridicatum]